MSVKRVDVVFMMKNGSLISLTENALEETA